MSTLSGFATRTRLQLQVLIAPVLAVLVGVVAAETRDVRLAVAGASLIAIGAWLISYCRLTRATALSPVAALVVTYVLIAALGPLVRNTVASGAGVSASLSFDDNVAYSTYFVFLGSAAAVLAGASVYAAWLGRANNKPPFQAEQRRGELSTRQVSIVTALALVMAILPLVLYIAAYGSLLLQRSEYIPFTGTAVAIGAATLVLPALMVLGWLFAKGPNPTRFVAALAVSAYVLVLFSLATRALALVPLIVTFGVIAAKPNRRTNLLRVASAALLAVALLEVPLVLRTSSGGHGLFPYFTMVISDPAQFATQDFRILATNILFSFSLTGVVGFMTAPLDVGSLITSLNPLPGATVGWYDLQPSLRINLYTPFNTLGELINHGWYVLLLFYFAVGLYLGRIEAVIRKSRTPLAGWPALILFGLAILFAFESLEYNLRSSVRLIYYAAAIDFMLIVVGRLSLRNHSRLAHELSDEARPDIYRASSARILRSPRVG